MRVNLESMQNALPPEFSVFEAKEFLDRHYGAPLKLLSMLRNTGVLLRLKRDLYVFAANLNRLAAAGSIHGPSYVSFETALAHYGLIPEKVETVFSVVDGRTASFSTPVGLYKYHRQARQLFAEGMGMQQGANRSYLIATQEKAVLDTLDRARLPSATLLPHQVLAFVVDSIRIREEQLHALSLRKMQRLAKHYRNNGPSKLSSALALARREKRKPL